MAQQARRAGEATAQTSFDVRNTSAVSSTSGAGYREGGFDEMIEDQEEFREERRRSVEELSKEEEETVEYANLKMDQADSIRENIDKQLKKVNSAITKRNKLQNKMAEARNNNDAELLNNLRNQRNQLIQDTKGVESVSDLNNLDNRKDTLKDRKKTVRNEKKKFRKMAKIGQNRGEEYVQNMMEQQSVMDKLNSRIKQSTSYVTGKDVFENEDYTDVTTKTKGNRSFSVEQADRIDSKDRKRKLSRLLNK
jgi:ElaB/YqjD/DUF883 family membrane-anchored ribosome-binding protein